MVCFVNIYSMDSDLSCGQRYQAFKQLGPNDDSIGTMMKIASFLS